MTAKALPMRARASRPSITVPVSIRVLAVALTYALGRLAAAVAAAGVTGSSPSFDPAGEIAAAALVGASQAWLASRITGSSAQRTATLSGLLFASVAAVMIEGSAFAPTLSPSERLSVGLVLQLAVSVVTARVAVVSRGSVATAVAASDRGLPSLVARLAGAALVYVVAYFATGAINYAVVTGPYYETNAGGLSTPAPMIVLVVALAEGLLLAVGAIPLATSFTGSWRVRALATGGALWVLGGLVPLLQETSLPDVLRVASAVEILFQKVPLGIAVAWLFTAGPLAPVDRAEDRHGVGGRP